MKEVNYILEKASYNNEEGTDVPVFYNLVWLTTKEAAVYLRKNVNAIHKMVHLRKLKARKFHNRLYFKREELDYLLETSEFIGG